MEVIQSDGRLTVILHDDLSSSPVVLISEEDGAPAGYTVWLHPSMPLLEVLKDNGCSAIQTREVIASLIQGEDARLLFDLPT